MWELESGIGCVLEFNNILVNPDFAATSIPLESVYLSSYPGSPKDTPGSNQQTET